MGKKWSEKLMSLGNIIQSLLLLRSSHEILLSVLPFLLKDAPVDPPSTSKACPLCSFSIGWGLSLCSAFDEWREPVAKQNAELGQWSVNESNGDQSLWRISPQF